MMARRFKPDYTAEDVISLWKSRTEDGDEARIRKIAGTMRALTRMEHPVDVPAQYKAITKQVRTPYVRDSWHRITASLLHKSPIVHIEPKDDRKKEAREATSTAERWHMAAMERMSREQGEDAVYADCAALTRDGEGVLKVAHKPSAWANFPERGGEDAGEYLDKADQYKKSAAFPIAWRNVDRLTVCFEDGEFGDDWAIESADYARPLLRTRYGMVEHNDRLVTPKFALSGRPAPEGELTAGSNGMSRKTEFFTSSEWHVLIDGMEAPGFPKENPYLGNIPYFRGAAYDRESLLYSLLFLVPTLDSLLTMKMNWSYLGAYPNPVISSVPNAIQGGIDGLGGETAGEPSPALKWQPGKAIELPIGKTLAFLSPPPIGADLNDLVGIIRSLIDVAGIPSVMRGTSSMDSGYLANQMLAAAAMSYKIASISLQRQHEKALEFIQEIIRSTIKQTVYVVGWDSINAKTGKPSMKARNAWLGLSPDTSGRNVASVTDLGPLSMKFRSQLPTDQQAQSMIALQLTQAQKPLISIRHALEEYLQEEDPDSIADEIAVEKALEAGPLAQMVQDEALREAGILPPAQQSTNPASALVNPQGQPLMSTGMQGLPGQAQAGLPSVQGINMPMSPQPPQQGVPGATGGRPAGAYPGQPGGQNG